MAYEARVFQILIASPGDVSDERNILEHVIYEWNSVYSRDRRVVLLPLRWETNSSPEMGDPPQAILNRQFVDQCDMAIGVFWTRLGTPTSEAESGTAEEIERVATAGKQVMLYFSRAKVDPDALDIHEYQRLKAFKSKTYPNGLIESYSSLTEFKEKLTRQLAMKLLMIIADDSREHARSTDLGPRLIDVVLGSPKRILTSPAVVRVPRIVCADEIPDYSETEVGDDRTAARIGYAGRKGVDYYRNLVATFIRQSMTRPLRIGVRGISRIGAHGIYLEMQIRPTMGKFRVREAPSRPGYYSHRNVFISFDSLAWKDRDGSGDNSLDQLEAAVLAIGVDEFGNDRIEMTLPVVQAGRTIFSSNQLIIDTDGESASAAIHVTVYSTDMPPFSLQLDVQILVEERAMSFSEILKEADPPPDDTVINTGQYL